MSAVLPSALESELELSELESELELSELASELELELSALESELELELSALESELEPSALESELGVDELLALDVSSGLGALEESLSGGVVSLSVAIVHITHARKQSLRRIAKVGYNIRVLLRNARSRRRRRRKQSLHAPRFAKRLISAAS